MIPEPRSAPPTPAPSRRGTPRGGLTVRPLIIFLILLFVASALVSAPTWAATIPPPPPPISSGNHLPRAASNPVAPEPPRSPEALPSEPVVSRGALVAPEVPVYDPGAGLFLQLDPSGYADSPNLYAGFANDPINHRDPTGRLADLPGHEASPQSVAVLRSYASGAGDLYTAILRSPTLRPKDVERAAMAGRLARTDLHPGSTALGTIGEVLVAHNLNSQDGSIPGQLLTHLVLEPAMAALPKEVPPELQTVLGAAADGTLPDILAVQLAPPNPIGTVEVLWSDVVSKETGGSVSRVGFGPNTTIVSLWEVTTTTPFEHLETRAAKVAAWAKVLSSAKQKGVTAKAVLAIDRGVFFKLSEAQRKALVDTVTRAGGYIRLYRDLTKNALSSLRGLQQDLQKANLR